MEGGDGLQSGQEKTVKKILVVICEDSKHESSQAGFSSPNDCKERNLFATRTVGASPDLCLRESHQAQEDRGGQGSPNFWSSSVKDEHPEVSATYCDKTSPQALGEIFSRPTLERHILQRPTLQEYKDEIEGFAPNVVYFHSEASTGDLGPLLFKGSNDVSVTSVVSSIRGCLPEMVVLGVASALSYAEAMRAAAVPHVVYWPTVVTAKLAHHFGVVLVGILQSQACGAWDSFHLAEASVRMYCSRTGKHLASAAKSGPGRQNSTGSNAARQSAVPTLLGKPPPKPWIPYTMESGPGGTEKGVSAGPKAGGRQPVGAVPPEVLVVSGSVKCRAALALDMDRMDVVQETALADAMETVLAIEARGIRLVGHPVSVPPPAEAAVVLASSSQTITMRCDICTTNGSRVAVVVAAAKDVFADEKILQQSIRRSLLDAKHVQPLFSKEGSLCRPPVSEAVGYGIDNVEGNFLVADWGRNVLYQLAHRRSFRLFGLAGIVQIQGYGVDGFTREDFLYYHVLGSMDVIVPETPPLITPTPLEWRAWSECRPPPFARSPEEALTGWEEAQARGKSAHQGSENRSDSHPSVVEEVMSVGPLAKSDSGASCEGGGSAGSPPFAVRVSQRIAAARQAGADWGVEYGLSSQHAPPLEWPPRPDPAPMEVRRAALRPVPAAFRRRPSVTRVAVPPTAAALPGGAVAEGDLSEPGEGTAGEFGVGEEDEGPWALSGGASRWNGEANTSGGPGHTNLPASGTGSQHTPGATPAVMRPQPALPIIQDVPPHGCNRKHLDECTEEEFMQDLVNFLVARGHGRLIPTGGVSAFPDCNLNGSKLDLYNLYREVVTRGGFHVGNGINWKGQIFSNMRNHTSGNKMTGVGNTLKKHYLQYLGEYERAHNDIVGEYCAVCHSAAAGDWILCNHCSRWFHYACDPRPQLPSYKHFSCEDGPAYFCMNCSDARGGGRGRFDIDTSISRDQVEGGAYKAKVPNKRARI